MDNQTFESEILEISGKMTDLANKVRANRGLPPMPTIERNQKIDPANFKTKEEELLYNQRLETFSRESKEGAEQALKAHRAIMRLAAQPE